MEATPDKKQQRIWPGRHVVDFDLRSLASLRIAYGVILLLDAMTRWTDRVAHYSDYGVLPRTDLMELGWEHNWISVHMSSGSLGWLNFLFLIQVVAAVALLVGWRTRIATFLSWALLISIHSRNPLVLNGGDVYLRVILFWMLFLPWGQKWSVDSRNGRPDKGWWMPPLTHDRKAVRSFACLAVVLQVCYIYWFAVIPRTDTSWTADYNATLLALKLDQFATPFGYFFGDTFASWLPAITWAVIVWEVIGPFCLLFPFDRGQVRLVGIFGFMVMHAGFGMCMELGFFAWIGILTPLVLLPTWFWEVPARRLARWLDTRVGKVSEDSEEPYRDIPLLTFFRELFYCTLILYTLCWNLGNENCSPNLRLPSSSHWLGHSLRLDQRWNMFSPGPLTQDGWYVIEARRADGSTLDLFREGQEVVWDKPDRVAQTYKNQRWRKFMMNLWDRDNQKYRLPYGRYLSRRWNQKGRGPQEVSQFKIYFMMEQTNPDGSEEPPEKTMIWQHWCFQDGERTLSKERNGTSSGPNV